MTLKDLIKPQEGYRGKPYRDTVGKLTIGNGRNVDDVGISEDELAHLGRTLEDILENGVSESEADYLLGNDIEKAIRECRRVFPWFEELDNVRQAVVVDMVFNMGLSAFLTFKNTIAMIKVGNYRGAAEHMKASLWHKQVGKRADDLARMMETGHAYAG